MLHKFSELESRMSAEAIKRSEEKYKKLKRILDKRMCKYYDENEESKTYMTLPTSFDVLAWIELCRGFLEYVENLDLTNKEQHLRQGMDEYILRGLHQIERQCSELVRVAKFLIDIRPVPTRDYLYVSSITMGDIGREEEDEEEK